MAELENSCDEFMADVIETYQTYANQLLNIFRIGNQRWDEAEIIVRDVKNWIIKNKLDSRAIFQYIINYHKNQPRSAEYACFLGFLYRWGIGTEPDEKKAFHWYMISAENGDSLGQNELGICYDFGDGVETDMSKASCWYLRSAVAGNALGQHNIGLCFSQGIGIFKDDEKAFYWFEKSAIAGHRGGQSELGHCYTKGIGVKKDLRKGYFWLRKAAFAGNTMAQSLIADRHHYGLGISLDIHEAIKWHRKVIRAMQQPEYPKLIWLFEKQSS
ncbi:hypothetical protein G9A89_012555 [Geosiphon pyriformis]|nr:hypothetical protein G9A89_012555 [Geosiphon pyriformis]